MVELLRTNDPVLISFLTAFFKSYDIEIYVLDYYASMMEGSVSAIPRRIMIDSELEDQARALMREAGISHLVPAR